MYKKLIVTALLLAPFALKAMEADDAGHGAPVALVCPPRPQKVALARHALPAIQEVKSLKDLCVGALAKIIKNQSTPQKELMCSQISQNIPDEVCSPLIKQLYVPARVISHESQSPRAIQMSPAMHYLSRAKTPPMPQPELSADSKRKADLLEAARRKTPKKRLDF